MEELEALYVNGGNSARAFDLALVGLLKNMKLKDLLLFQLKNAEFKNMVLAKFEEICLPIIMQALKEVENEDFCNYWKDLISANEATSLMGMHKKNCEELLSLTSMTADWDYMKVFDYFSNNHISDNVLVSGLMHQKFCKVSKCPICEMTRECMTPKLAFDRLTTQIGELNVKIGNLKREIARLNGGEETKKRKL